MTLHTSVDAPITGAYWDELCDEDGFLALGRNRYTYGYVVYTDGTYCYAENGTTGNLDFGGPNNLGGINGIDASAVIQAAINELEAQQYGTAFLRVGKYILDTQLSVESNYIYIIGECTGYNNLGTELCINNDDGAIRFGSAGGAQITGCQLANLFIRNYSAGSVNSTGVRTYNLHASLFSNLRVRGLSGGRGMWLDESSNSNTIMKLNTTGGCLYGLYLGSAAGPANAITVFGATCYGSATPNEYGIYIYSGDTFKGYGIYIDSVEYGVYVNDDYAEFYGLRLENIGTMGITLDSGADYTKFFGGTLFGSVTINNGCTNCMLFGSVATIINNGGTTNKFYDVVGHTTKNQGAGEVIAAAATSVAVAHGLSYTPTAAEISVVLTNLPTNDIGDVYLSAIGAANFTINCRNVPGVATAIFSWAVRRV